ncbi:MAG: TlyA family RNA methyltransferase [Clostridia bacterium]|nr:TlyA family RNA methyltransferase [Clostridia bacterium]
MRADLYLVEKGYVPSRQRAKMLIEEKNVLVDGVVLTKPSQQLDGEHTVVIQNDLLYVSRGGLKLRAALDAFSIDPTGMNALDIGASTGGFTDCLLQGGAVHVWAVDSGVGQLVPSLASDPRVDSLEHTNARELALSQIGGASVDLIVMDVSFISATYLIPRFPLLLRQNGSAVCLIKPQFEVGKAFLGKGGIVKDKRAHRAAIERVLDAGIGVGLTPIGLVASPIEGGDGNREFLVHFINQADGVSCLSAERISVLTGAVSHWRKEKNKC